MLTSMIEPYLLPGAIVVLGLVILFAILLWIRGRALNALGSQATVMSLTEGEASTRMAELSADLSKQSSLLEITRGEKEKAERELAVSGELIRQLRESLSTADARLATQAEEQQRAIKKFDDLREDKSKADERLADVSARLSGETARADDLKVKHDRKTEEYAVLNKEYATLQSRYAVLLETAEQAERHAEEKLAMLTQARDALTKEFKVLAGDILRQETEQFTKQNKEQVGGLLDPLRQKIDEFQLSLQAAHTDSAKERASLAQQIRGLSDVSLKMTEETTNLTKALKGKSQTQGAWGELVLSTILERSGLRAGEEYVVQQSFSGDDGARLRPDVIVNLPNGQRIVIDAKLSLTSFEAYVNAEIEEERQEHLVRHVASVRGHIRTLASKEYQQVTNSGVDYVIMFVPIGPALEAAMRADSSIAMAAVDQNVALATPETLMIALKTAAHIWQVERRNQNAEAIADRAGKLYDKFVGFVEDFVGIDKQLTAAKGSYDSAFKKLSAGPGNLIRQAELLKEMGAKTVKSLPPAATATLQLEGSGDVSQSDEA
ncbi:MAG: DNA recombination protein RmuC [Rhodospirillaceae bacterium]|nr:DNA recombination protein RmuC [Rhodospirillaceae bacterium]